MRRLRGRDRCLAGLARFMPQQAVRAFLSEALLPAPYHRAADAKLHRHSLHRSALDRREHDLRALDMLLRTIAISDNRLQHLPIRRTQNHAYRLCHGSRLARPAANVNRLIGSEH